MNLAPLEVLILTVFPFLKGNRPCLDVLLSSTLDETTDVRECSPYPQKFRAGLQLSLKNRVIVVKL